MKIAFVADTHRSEKAVREALKHIDNYNAEILIHLGDYVGDVKTFEKHFNGKIYAVAGNCDFTFDYPKENSITINGVKIYYTHGDLYNVKSSLNSIALKGESEKANIVLFGHTHLAIREDYKNIIFMNPGSIPKPSSYSAFGAVGLITIDDDGTISDIRLEPVHIK